MLALAAREADIVTLSWLPRTTEAEADSIVDTFRELAGNRLSDIELSMNLMAIGDRPAPHIARFAGVDVPELVAGGAVTVLPENVAAAGKPFSAGANGGGFPTSRSIPAMRNPSPRSPGRCVHLGECPSDQARNRPTLLCFRATWFGAC